jgi:hypothetical protein
VHFCQGWKKPGFKKKTAQWVFLGGFLVFLGYLFFYIFAQKREEFLGFFDFQFQE